MWYLINSISLHKSSQYHETTVHTMTITQGSDFCRSENLHKWQNATASGKKLLLCKSENYLWELVGARKLRTQSE
jgi:hypothetical protein